MVVDLHFKMWFALEITPAHSFFQDVRCDRFHINGRIKTGKNRYVVALQSSMRMHSDLAARHSFL